MLTCPNCGFSGEENEFSSGYCPECDFDTYQIDTNVQEPINCDLDEIDPIEWNFD